MQARSSSEAVTARVEGSSLHVEICDDGVGGAQPEGSGLREIRDRLPPRQAGFGSTAPRAAARSSGPSSPSLRTNACPSRRARERAGRYWTTAANDGVGPRQQRWTTVRYARLIRRAAETRHGSRDRRLLLSGPDPALSLVVASTHTNQTRSDWSYCDGGPRPKGSPLALAASERCHNEGPAGGCARRNRRWLHHGRVADGRCRDRPEPHGRAWHSPDALDTAGGHLERRLRRAPLPRQLPLHPGVRWDRRPHGELADPRDRGRRCC